MYFKKKYKEVLLDDVFYTKEVEIIWLNQKTFSSKAEYVTDLLCSIRNGIDANKEAKNHQHVFSSEEWTRIYLCVKYFHRVFSSFENCSYLQD